MYKIGEFSKLVDISTRTLRYYDEEKILVPNYVDKYTGYRMYDDDNIKECELIKLLKLANFTLNEIAENKECLSEDLFEEKQEEILKQIKYLKMQYKLIEGMKKDLENHEECKILRRKNERENFKTNSGE